MYRTLWPYGEGIKSGYYMVRLNVRGGSQKKNKKSNMSELTFVCLEKTTLIAVSLFTFE